VGDLQKAFIYLSLTLLLVGIIISIAGLYFILIEGIRVYYKDLNLVVPVYEVSTKWPGNYSEVVDIPLVMVEVVGRPFSEPWSYTYNVSIPWSNCTGGGDLWFVLEGYKSLGNASLYVVIDVYGCNDNGCRLLVSRDTASLREEEGGCGFNGELRCKFGFNTNDSILNYKYINISAKPARGLTIDYFEALTTLTCSFNYTQPYPINTFSKGSDFYYLRFPTYIDPSGLLNGLCLSLVGLLLILVSIYLRIHLKTIY
jgi:hypothetical protein